MNYHTTTCDTLMRNRDCTCPPKDDSLTADEYRRAALTLLRWAEEEHLRAERLTNRNQALRQMAARDQMGEPE